MWYAPKPEGRPWKESDMGKVSLEYRERDRHGQTHELCGLDAGEDKVEEGGEEMELLDYGKREDGGGVLEDEQDRLPVGIDERQRLMESSVGRRAEAREGGDNEL